MAERAHQVKALITSLYISADTLFILSSGVVLRFTFVMTRSLIGVALLLLFNAQRTTRPFIKLKLWHRSSNVIHYVYYGGDFSVKLE